MKTIPIHIFGRTKTIKLKKSTHIQGRLNSRASKRHVARRNKTALVPSGQTETSFKIEDLLGSAYERGLSRYVGPGHELARRAKKGQPSK
jgi:hypothetical protein